MKDLIKLRFENKYILSKSAYYRLVNSIKPISIHDAYSALGKTYKVRSLYYDNRDFSAYVEKINGINIRDKFRIRTYETDENKISKNTKNVKKLFRVSRLHSVAGRRACTTTAEQWGELLSSVRS